MTTLFAAQALLADGFCDDVLVEIGADGRIARIEKGAAAPEGASTCDILLPAPANLHSHAFQRAMAGLTERRGEAERDTFWTWRQLMFRFLDALQPDDVEAIAALVQMEMLEAGYGASVEFHYLHHSPGGTPYENLGEMCDAIAAAATQTGIGLTLLPVHYAVGGCDGRALAPGQVRFGNDLERFARLLEAAGNAIAPLADARLGVAPHSLRAVPAQDIPAVAALTDGPVHMHIAEQVAEVDEVRAAHGARPVAFALDTLPLDKRWCLIHCTQMEPDETTRLAATGVVAGLCPITEASLGDGVFDGVRWQDAGGIYGFGSDSNVRIRLAEELRALEFSQRLRERCRAALATRTRSTGRVLYDAALAGGAQAAGRPCGTLETGAYADLLALDGTAIDLEGRTGEDVLDAFIFASGEDAVRDVWSAGRHVVKDGRHVRRAEIVKAYRARMADLRERL